MSTNTKKRDTQTTGRRTDMAKPVTANRLHVSYPDSMKPRLEEIQRQTGQASLSEVFRQAILFYTLAFEEHEKGSDFLIRNRDGEVERLRMFL